MIIRDSFSQKESWVDFNTFEIYGYSKKGNNLQLTFRHLNQTSTVKYAMKSSVEVGQSDGGHSDCPQLVSLYAVARIDP